MTRLKVLCVAALCMTAAAAVPANAAPLGAALKEGATTRIDNSVSKVHYRRYRHCHRRYGRRRCHGRRHYRRGWWPGVGIYLGSRRHHHHRHHRHWRKRRH